MSERAGKDTGRGKWIRPAIGVYGPSCVVSVVSELVKINRNTGTGKTIYGLSAIHVSESHRRGAHWSAASYRRFTNGAAFYDWLEDFSSATRKTYVFTHSVLDFLSLSEFWERIETHGCRLVDSSPSSHPPSGTVHEQIYDRSSTASLISQGSDTTDPTYYFRSFIPGVNAEIVNYRKNGKSYQWCKHAQYCNASERQIAASINYQWHPRESIDDSSESHQYEAWDIAGMWHKFYREMIAWWIDIGGGPWGPTAAAMSYSFLRMRIPLKTILHHNDERAGALEERAIFGGRRALWYIGNIGTHEDWDNYSHIAPTRSGYGTIEQCMHHHDIRSMYPYLLSCMPYPIRLLSYSNTMSKGACLDALQNYGLIADVLLKTDTPEYPHKSERGIRYPIGIFRTTLCGPELMAALTSDRVLEITCASVYTMGMPFRSACNTLLSLRTKYRDSRQRGWELFVKQLSNSMSGKLAPHDYHWKPLPDKAPMKDWGRWYELNSRGSVEEHYRSFAGMTFRRVAAEIKSRKMAAAYAYLTSYGRWYMSLVRSICPAETVIAMDTDGIWTLASATPHLYMDGDADSAESGMLHMDIVSAAGRFFGPQHYWYGDAWIMSGSAIHKVHPGSSRIDVLERQSVVLHTQQRPQPLVYESVLQRQLWKVHAHGTPNEHGWMIPEQLWQMYDDDPAA